jgi:hypothetical protein
VGLYRVPGSEREVKDLKEKFLKGKGSPILSKVSNIQVKYGGRSTKSLFGLHVT